MSEIPGWFDWALFYRHAVEQASDGARFVETGCFFGKSAYFLAAEIQLSGKQIHFDTWDSWEGVPPEFGLPGWTGVEQPSEERARLTLAGLPVHVRTGDALEAARCYPDGSLDLVFLDDDHKADHVAAECAAWWPKVRVGGVMAGHDYDWPSVHEGVHRWASAAGVVVHPVSHRCWEVQR